MSIPEKILALHFVIEIPKTAPITMVIDADRVIVGSGAHCEVRLPPEEASPEHLEVRRTVAGVHARARALDDLPRLDGVPFDEGPIHEDAVVTIGAVSLRIRAVEVAPSDATFRAPKNRTSPLALVGAAVIAIGCLAIIFDDDAPRARDPIPDDAPRLFAEPVSRCSVDDPEQAGALASERWIAAEGKAERRAFDAKDGIAAVPLYELAAACFARAGDDDSAAEALDRGKSLRRSIEEDYHVHRVRLAHALTVDDAVTARKETRILRAFTQAAVAGGSPSRYVGWLESLERRLEIARTRRKS
jgi:hypothetical protein